MKLVFLLEEPSMEAALRNLIPLLCPHWTEGLNWLCVPHQGKSDLRKSIPRKLRGWKEPGVRFLVLHDNDSGDCRALKRELDDMCARAGRPDTVVRIVVQELEAWFLGDLEAVGKAFGIEGLGAAKRRFQIPDRVGRPSHEMGKLVTGYAKLDGARRISGFMDVHRNHSDSFRALANSVRAFCVNSEPLPESEP